MRLALFIATCGLLARTASGDPLDADGLFEQGRAFAKAGQYAEACESFARSLAIDRTIGTELNLADCHQHLGHLREAWGLFASAASDAEAANDPKRATFAHERARLLEPALTAVVVKLAQPDTEGLIVTIAGRAVTPALEIHELADPGVIDVAASAPNHPRIVRTATGLAGATVVIEVPAWQPISVISPPPAVAVDGNRERGRTRIAYGFGAASAASAVTALAFTIVGDLHYDNVANGADCAHVTGGITCNPTGTAAIHAAQHLADLGTVFAIGSAVLAGSAAIIYFTAPRERIYLRPQATAREAGLVFGGTF